ncbi:hypothetical protein CR513_47540, partial [Mucuna pruriens]
MVTKWERIGYELKVGRDKIIVVAVAVVVAAMAYRRRHEISRASTFKEEIRSDGNGNDPPLPSLSSSFSFGPSSSSSSSPSSLAAQAIKASAARRDPFLSFAFAIDEHDHHRSKSCDNHGDVSKSGVWGVLAQKAKEILEDDKSSSQHNDIMLERLRTQPLNTFSPSTRAQKTLNIFPSSILLQEGVESKTTYLKLPIKLKESSPRYSNSNQVSGTWNPWQKIAQQGDYKTIYEIQLKASRDVAMATAAKAKLLLRELKTVKADLAFSKARCAQLEEENKLLRDREGSEKGPNVNRADDDLIRLQLETLLAEKGRLASENEIYARENCFLREIVEYHQLTTQDVVYLDEGMEEVTELYPVDTFDTTVPRVMPKSLLWPLSQASQTKTLFHVPQEQEEEDDNNIPQLDDDSPRSF